MEPENRLKIRNFDKSEENVMSADSVCDTIGYHQGSEFIHALERAGLTSAIAQEVITSKGNQRAKAMMAAIEVRAPEKPREEKEKPHFKFVTSFDVAVAANYDHATRLDTFKRGHGEEFYFYNADITDEHFTKATTKLAPGRKLVVKIFQITRRVSSEECLAFLKTQKAVLVGAQGATLAYGEGKDQLPKGRWHISFDEKEALWEDAIGCHRVPYVSAGSGGDFWFRLGSFGGDWRGGGCLLCFCDSPAEASA